MKRSVKAKTRRGAARDQFAELSEGMEALAEGRQGKRTLRTHAVEYEPPPTVTPQELMWKARGMMNHHLGKHLTLCL